jgi:hypothetical protein
MSILLNLKSRLGALFRKKRLERELDEELGDFPEMAAEARMKEGLSRKIGHASPMECDLAKPRAENRRAVGQHLWMVRFRKSGCIPC